MPPEKIRLTPLSYFFIITITRRMIPKQVSCMITGVAHTVVTESQNVKKLENYCKQTFQRLNRGEKIYFAVDCEGFALGTSLNSLGLLQFAECYHDGIPPENKSIQLKPGFLVKTPFTPETIKGLSSIFSHRNSRLIMFACAGDVSMLMHNQIQIELSTVIDCQAIETWSRSLLSTVQQANNVFEYNIAGEVLNMKQSVCFEQIYYQHYKEKDPFSSMLTEEFWKYSANDIALTALALAGALKLNNYNLNELVHNSSTITSDILYLIDNFGILAPSINRTVQFEPKCMNGRIPNTEKALKLFYTTSVYISNYDLYEELCPDYQRYTKAELMKANKKALQYLNSTSSPKATAKNKNSPSKYKSPTVVTKSDHSTKLVFETNNKTDSKPIQVQNIPQYENYCMGNYLYPFYYPYLANDLQFYSNPNANQNYFQMFGFAKQNPSNTIGNYNSTKNLQSFGFQPDQLFRENCYVHSVHSESRQSRIRRMRN